VLEYNMLKRLVLLTNYIPNLKIIDRFTNLLL